MWNHWDHHHWVVRYFHHLSASLPLSPILPCLQISIHTAKSLSFYWIFTAWPASPHWEWAHSWKWCGGKGQDFSWRCCEFHSYQPLTGWVASFEPHFSLAVDLSAFFNSTSMCSMIPQKEGASSTLLPVSTRTPSQPEKVLIFCLPKASWLHPGSVYLFF